MIKDILDRPVDTPVVPETTTEDDFVFETPSVQQVIIEVKEASQSLFEPLVTRWTTLPEKRQRFFLLLGVSIFASTVMSVVTTIVVRFFKKH